MYGTVQNLFVEVLLFELPYGVSQQRILLQQLPSRYICQFERLTVLDLHFSVFGVHVFDYLLHQVFGRTGRVPGYLQQ